MPQTSEGTARVAGNTSSSQEFERLVLAASRSFALTLQLAPPKVRSTLTLAYGLARTSDTIADCGTMPVADRIRLLANLPQGLETNAGLSNLSPSESALLEVMPRMLAALESSPDRDLVVRVWSTIREGQVFDLQRFPSVEPMTPTELADYIYLVAGCVGEFWTDLCLKHLPEYSVLDPETLRIKGRIFGEALQRVNVLRDRSADAIAGRIYVPEDRVREECDAARDGLYSGLDYAASLQSIRLRAAVALPAKIGLDTLGLIQKRPNTNRVRVSRFRVWMHLIAAACMPPATRRQ